MSGRARGEDLLLSHLAALDRLTEGEGRPARSRLEDELGRDEASQLVRTLSARVRAALGPSRAP